MLSLFLLCFIAFQIFYLNQWPTVHSDELWLSHLALSMRDNLQFWQTEPFFDLYPRVVHPFRWAYVGLQIVYMTLFKHPLYSARLLSLTFATLSLALSKKIGGLRLSLLLALNITFLYSAHIARQESIMLFLMLLAYYFINKKQVFNTSLVIALAIGVHPNAFLIAVGTFCVSMCLLWFKEVTWHHPMKLVVYTSFFAGLYAIVGYLMNPHVFSEYYAFGASLGADAPLLGRFEGFYWFLYKLYHQIGGTYDMLSLKTYFFMALGIVPCLFIAKKRGDQSLYPPFSMLIGIATASIIIGRYNTLSIVFWMPWVIMIYINTLSGFKRQLRTALLAILILINASNTLSNLKSYQDDRPYEKAYAQMVSEIRASTPLDVAVLGNLNTIEAFDGKPFYDVRNLAFAPDVVAYLSERSIGYVIWHEELDYIIRNAPKWDFLYEGTDQLIALKHYLDSHARLVQTIENPTYAMRISKYSGTYPWRTFIYEIP